MPWGAGHGERLGKTGWERQADNRRIFERDGHRCQISGPRCISRATEVDHRIPLSVTGPGGDHDANKQAACVPCHRAKSACERVAGQAKKSRHRPTEPHPGLMSERGGG